MLDNRALIEALLPAVRAAGNAIMDVYRRPPQSDAKADGSPVTEADARAEAILLDALGQHAPDTTVISEENAASHHLVAPDRFFLVDPLDGTREFLKRDGQGAFTVNVALIEGGEPVLGIIHAPARDALFAGIVGESAWEIVGEEWRPIRVAPDGNEAIALASVSHKDRQTEDWFEQAEIGSVTRIGSSLKFCLIASGEAHLYPRFGPTMEWDTAAGDAILRAAGGMVTDATGASFRYGKANYTNGPFLAQASREHRLR